MRNEFIPYEEALALKELGFDDSELEVRDINTFEAPNNIEARLDYFGTEKESNLHRPILYQQAFRWFREKYKLHAEIIVQLGFKHWNAQILPSGRWLKPTAKKGFKTYEEAELACLRKLIEIVKNKED